MPRFAALHVWLLPLALFVGREAAGAQEPEFWKDLTPGSLLPRCAESSIAFKDAEARLNRFDDYLEGLGPTSSPAAAVGALHALMRSECFLPAAETVRIPHPDSSLSLKRWWDDGGFSWLYGYLHLPRFGDVSKLRAHIGTPPDARATLTPERLASSPLRPLICPLEDTACGQETLGWIRRAEQAFELHRVAHVNDAGVLGDPSPPPSTPEAVSDYCAKDLPASTNAERYGKWRECVELRRPKTSALPLGRIRAPNLGWLIVTGRRGHYNFCDTVNAYDLGTGAAFVHESCSALHLIAGGDVDRSATDKRRLESVRSGTLPVENLREALWMMLLQEQTRRLQIRDEWYPLPDGLMPETVVRSASDMMMFDSVSVSTAQTILAWRWIPISGPAITGEVIWPSSFDGAEDHAAALLDIAELALVPGCVPQSAPAESVIGRPVMRVHPSDAPPNAEFPARFAAAYKLWASAPVCSVPR